MKQKTLLSAGGLLLAAALSVAVITIVNTSLTGIRFDLTEKKLFTLSDGTENIIRALDEPVTLKFYFSNAALQDYPALMIYGNRVRDMLKEYAAKSAGNIELIVIEPEAFSEEEDQAVASGLQGAPVNTSGDLAYFGLVGTNATDEELTIPFFRNERESALEYDITKLVFNLAYPKKRVVGVISSLPIFGSGPQPAPVMPGMPMPPQQPAWGIIDTTQEFFEMRDLGMGVESIEGVDVLMVIHPKNISEKTLFAIDQYVLAGGNAMLFVDPLADGDQTQANPQNPMILPDRSSNLDKLFAAWGIEVTDSEVVADSINGMRVQTNGPRGPEEVLYLPWLGLGPDYLNRDDFSISELESINLGSAGAIKTTDDSNLETIVLIQSSDQSMMMDKDLLVFQQDPSAMLNDFVPDNESKILVARFSGKVITAFPDGLPVESTEEGDESAVEASLIDPSDIIQEGDINIIVSGDTDILNDMFWMRSQNFLGMQIRSAFANNGDFIVNALEVLSGNNDLISLRSRGEFSRPFTRVDQIRREAEEAYRDREKELQVRLEETEQRIAELQQNSEGSDLILSREQTDEIDKFREEMVATRKELRAVQHELQKNIEGLGSRLKFINIALMPLLIMLFAISTWLVLSRRNSRVKQS
jgi:ABC-type uncharacterized transport system involved in gliding motility auxiliary subunit